MFMGMLEFDFADPGLRDMTQVCTGKPASPSQPWENELSQPMEIFPRILIL